MTNHDNGGDAEDDDGDDNRNDDGNDDGNDNDNAASASGFDGPIFDLIMTPRSSLVISEMYWMKTMPLQWPWRHIYICVGI